jgi:hypothetical protein
MAFGPSTLAALLYVAIDLAEISLCSMYEMEAARGYKAGASLMVEGKGAGCSVAMGIGMLSRDRLAVMFSRSLTCPRKTQPARIGTSCRGGNDEGGPRT